MSDALGGFLALWALAATVAAALAPTIVAVVRRRRSNHPWWAVLVMNLLPIPTLAGMAQIHELAAALLALPVIAVTWLIALVWSVSTRQVEYRGLPHPEYLQPVERPTHSETTYPTIWQVLGEQHRNGGN